MILTNKNWGFDNHERGILFSTNMARWKFGDLLAHDV
jgi:hypothetical protein